MGLVRAVISGHRPEVHRISSSQNGEDARLLLWSARPSPCKMNLMREVRRKASRVRKRYKSPFTVRISTKKRGQFAPQCYVRATRMPVAPGSAVG